MRKYPLALPGFVVLLASVLALAGEPVPTGASNIPHVVGPPSHHDHAGRRVSSLHESLPQRTDSDSSAGAGCSANGPANAHAGASLGPCSTSHGGSARTLGPSARNLAAFLNESEAVSILPNGVGGESTTREVATVLTVADLLAMPLPGRSLEVFPVGLIVLSVLWGAVFLTVGYMTYERIQYRRQFFARRREAQERQRRLLLLLPTEEGSERVGARWDA